MPGKCKTRLVPSIGAENAAALYRAFSSDVARTASRLPGDLHVAYDPHPPFRTPRWLSARAPFFLQSGRTLGDRLIHAFTKLFSAGYHRVVVIGSDSPTLSFRRLREAFRALNRWDAAFGPAVDGGYYLVGLRRPIPELFQNIPWSTRRVMAATRNILRRRKIPSTFLARHYDVDSPRDLLRLSRELRRLPRTACAATRAEMNRMNYSRRQR